MKSFRAVWSVLLVSGLAAHGFAQGGAKASGENYLCAARSGNHGCAIGSAAVG